MTTELRHRKKPNNENTHSNRLSNDVAETKSHGDTNTDLKDSYWLTRIVFLRSLAFIYFVAFLVALDQNKQLLGRNGLLPTDKYIARIKNHYKTSNSFQLFSNVPTLLLFIDEQNIDTWLDMIGYCGLILSAIVLIGGAANVFIMTALWLLYHSIVNIGQRWYSFGWESQLLETGFLAIFFCPMFSLEQLSRDKPSKVVIWGYRWLIFRIMIGAGLIKIRGDKCWRDLTCMNYHYETQPVPNPISYYLHQSPEVLHQFETLSNHFIELVVPWFILLTRKFRITCGVLQILFQVVLIISGNLSFLNWLTILPSICCFDDQSLKSIFTERKITELETHMKSEEKKPKHISFYIRTVLDFSLFILVAFLSIPVVQNLLSSNQAMNTSFDSFRIVNTYGAFGSVTKTRSEVILQGTRNVTIIPDGQWLEYEFKCKPGSVNRRPCLISPYHYRLDWLIWFAAFMNYQQNPWLLHLTAKLLVNDKNMTSLISYNPFMDGDPPKFIRAAHYKYEYTKLSEHSPDWWKRQYIGEYFPPVQLKSLEQFLHAHGWETPQVDTT